MDPRTYTDIALELLPFVPYWLLWLAMLGVCAITWRRHPAVSAVAGVSLVGMLVLSIVQAVLWQLTWWSIERGSYFLIDNIGLLMMPLDLLEALCFGGLVAAAVVGRTAR